MGIIYLPVPSAEMISVANKWNTGRVAKRKAAHTIIRCVGTGAVKVIRRVGFGALRNVTAAERMYVLLHGLQPAGNPAAVAVGANRGVRRGPGQIPNWQGGTRKSYTPTQLANHLDQEGLTHAFQDLRLFSCGAGIAVSAVIPSFAQRLKADLVALGFNNLTVTGYLGDLSASYVNVNLEPGDEPHPAAAHLTATTHKTIGANRKASSGHVQF